MQKKTKRNFKTVALSLLLVAAMVVTGISAYFTATDTKTNTFTVGSIKIDLQEPSWDENSAYPTTPNETVPKDPQIENIGMSDAYVYLTVEVPYANVDVADADGNVSAAADTELFSYTTNPGWVEVGTPTKDEAKGVYKHVYAYAADADTLTVLSPEATTATLFDEVKFANVVETPDDDGSLKDLLEGKDLDVVINAYGIETNIIGNEATPDYVWTVITNQVINGDTSEKPVLLEGDGSAYSLFAVPDLRFRSSAPMDEFQEVRVNGETVDPQYYTVSEGSTVINLSGEYLATLNADEHDIAIVSDAGAAEGSFTATKGIPEGCTYTVKATGEVLTADDELPDAPAEGDIYTTSDYEFHCWEALASDGTWMSFSDLGTTKEEFEAELGMGPWYMGVKDTTKESYGEIPTVIFGESIKSLATVFNGCANMKTAPEIPSCITILSGTFVNCTSLENITIPDNVTSLISTFANCTSLESVVIPDSVTSIGEQAFYKCSSLTSIEIPDSVISVGAKAFSNCTGLTSITIPDSVTTIGKQAFYKCTGLTSVKIPGSVTSIGELGLYSSGMFEGCTGLTSVDLGNGVQVIGSNTFKGCTNLTSIEIPDSVTTIGYNAFRMCHGLTSIYISKNVTTILADSSGGSPFWDCPSNLKIYCEASEAQSGWAQYWNHNGSTELSVTYGVSRAEYEALNAE